MANITAEMVKELREKTGVGMMDCKKALVESDGNMDLAIENLRKAGIAKAAKKAGRTAKQGCIVGLIEDNVGVMVELLCETDFAASNERFRAFAAAVAQRVAREYSVDGDVSQSVAEKEKAGITELIAVIGENMQLRRALRWQATGKLSSYVHMGGRIVVLAETAGEAPPNTLADMCMHIAAFSPRYIGPGDVPADVLAKEKEIAAAQVVGKPANIVDKIVMGKLSKWYTETCLLQQPWVRDDKTSLAKVAPALKVQRFLRWQVGEEI